MGLSLEPRTCLRLLRTLSHHHHHHGIQSRLLLPLTTTRGRRYEAFDARLDRDSLSEARAWFSKLDASLLPRGNTTFSRSSGAGGQHVNKTETKATTAYPVRELLALLPKSLHTHVRSSRYYTAGNDSLTFHAQTTRSRTANQEENSRKLMDEIVRIYRENTPNETSEDKKQKYEE
ncbi:peptidyl-tRNA hydrolase ICT1, partial [Geosmithia morbida]